MHNVFSSSKFNLSHIKSIIKGSNSTITIAQAYKQFMTDRAGYCADKTLITYAGHLGIFFDYLEQCHGPMEQLTFEELSPDDNIYSGYILYLRQKGTVTNATIRSYARSVKAFLNYCYQEDICRDYMKKVKLPKNDAVPPEPLLQEEVERLDSCFDMSTLKGLRNYCIIHLMVDCGLRSQEVLHLKMEHIDAAHNILHLLISKECKSRLTMIPDFVIDAIRRYMQLCGRSSGIVFYSLRKDEPLTENGIKLLFQDLKLEAELPRLHAHLLRHTFATAYLCGGGNLEFLRVMMGHSDYAVTKMYSSLAAQYKMLGVPVYKLDPIFYRILG